MVVQTVPSPPAQFKVVGLPAVTEVGSVVKASFDVCATAATAKEAPTSRAFARYMLTVLELVRWGEIWWVGGFKSIKRIRETDKRVAVWLNVDECQCIRRKDVEAKTEGLKKKKKGGD